MVELLFLTVLIALLIPNGHAFLLRLCAIVRATLGRWIYIVLPLGFFFLIMVTFHRVLFW